MVEFYDSTGARWSNLRKKFNPDQPRDEDGKWTDTGASTSDGKDKDGKPADARDKKLTPEQQKKFDHFERFAGLNPEDSEVQERSIHRYLTDKEGLMKAYVAKHGEKLVNADLARPLFEADGYTGTNAAAVQEASSALAKDRWREALANNKEQDAVLYAGGSGSGKSTAIDKLMPTVERDAAAVLDGNLSKLSSARGRLREVEDAGKTPHIIYAYREPTDAWENGVIHRMLHNKEEKGRVVPMSVFIDNSRGSLEVARALKDEGYRVTAIDNSRGRGNADFMSDSRLNTLTYPSPAALRATLTARTAQLLRSGKITKEQYDALLK